MPEFPSLWSTVSAGRAGPGQSPSTWSSPHLPLPARHLTCTLGSSSLSPSLSVIHPLACPSTPTAHLLCPAPRPKEPRRTGEMRAENTQQVVSAEHGRKIESSLDGRKVPWSPQFHHQIPDTLSPIFLSVLTGLNMPASKATLRIEQQGQQ